MVGVKHPQQGVEIHVPSGVWVNLCSEGDRMSRSGTLEPPSLGICSLRGVAWRQLSEAFLFVQQFYGTACQPRSPVRPIVTIS